MRKRPPGQVWRLRTRRSNLTKVDNIRDYCITESRVYTDAFSRKSSLPERPFRISWLASASAWNSPAPFLRKEEDKNPEWTRPWFFQALMLFQFTDSPGCFSKTNFSCCVNTLTAVLDHLGSSFGGGHNSSRALRNCNKAKGRFEASFSQNQTHLSTSKHTYTRLRPAMKACLLCFMYLDPFGIVNSIDLCHDTAALLKFDQKHE